jgi:predicted ester cyclase
VPWNPERNAATLQRLYDEVMNGHNVDAADELITMDRPDNDPTFPPELTAGRAGFKKLMTMLIGAFPDLRFTTELIVAGNDLVSAFRPHLSPNWFCWDGQRFYVSTTRSRVKYAIFRKDPRAQWLVDDSTGFRAVLARRRWRYARTSPRSCSAFA